MPGRLVFVRLAPSGFGSNDPSNRLFNGIQGNHPGSVVLPGRETYNSVQFIRCVTSGRSTTGRCVASRCAYLLPELSIPPCIALVAPRSG